MLTHINFYITIAKQIAVYPASLLSDRLPVCVRSDILKLAAAIQELTRCSRRTRTAIWCALVLTTHFSLNPELAGAEDVPAETLLLPLVAAAEPTAAAAAASN